MLPSAAFEALTARDAAKTPRRRWLLGCALSTLTVVLVPCLVCAVAYAYHLASFQGVCGPYATDIPAHPCAFSDYAANYFSGFGLTGLLVIAAGTAVVTAGFVFVAWIIAAFVVVLRKRPRFHARPR